MFEENVFPRDQKDLDHHVNQTVQELLFFRRQTIRKFCHGMSGAKSAGQVIDGSTSKGLYDPQRTSINFAVPNVNSVNNFDALETNIPKTISPGIITQTLNLLSRDKTYVLSVDGKKVANVRSLIIVKTFRYRHVYILTRRFCS
jgi:hypothetical protein